MTSLAISRSSACLFPDVKRVIARSFAPGVGAEIDGQLKIDRIINRVLALPESEVSVTLGVLNRRFATRHRDLPAVFERNFARISAHVPTTDISADRRSLIAAYFTHEYSLEAAALTNPSIVPAPDQQGVPPGAVRFVLSLRAIGEGHISSIEFRSGVVQADGRVEFDVASGFVQTARHHSPIYDKQSFSNKLVELGAYSEGAAAVLEPLAAQFTLPELEAAIGEADAGGLTESHGPAWVTRTLHWLASSNYESAFSPDTELSERVLFPARPTESGGMEDARFVRFAHGDGKLTYYATYTAYDGFQILPQLIETPDFLKFRIATLSGSYAKNKGIALFPRKVDGRFMALGRLDNERTFLLRSDDIHAWNEGEVLQTPQAPWEFTQIGNCGSPIETPAGWLVITHGVGAMRQYSLGAILLDLQDPQRIIGHLAEPLIEASDEERDGYVPNVVYSCGSMLAGEHLVLPYGFSDVGARVATLRVSDLLDRLVS